VDQEVAGGGTVSGFAGTGHKKDVKAKIMLIAYLKDIECYKHGWPVGREPCLFTESR
jgi:hypothetical protein